MEFRKYHLVACLLVVISTSFAQKLYIAENGAQQIQRSDLDGSNLEPVSLPLDVGSIQDMVIDEERNFAFWIENDATNTMVKRAAMLPTGGTVRFATPVDFIRVPVANSFEGLAIDKNARELFVTTSASGGNIYKFSLDASPTITVLPASTVSSLFASYGVAVDLVNNKMYFVNQATTRQIQIANLDGSSPSVIVNISGTLGTIYDVAVDPAGGKIYFSTNNTVGQIYEANLNGTSPLLIVDNLPTTVKGLAIDPGNGFIYWANGSTTVGRATLSGAGATNILTGLSTTNFIALDLSTTKPPKLYWTEGSLQEIHRINPDGTDFERYYFGSSPYPTGIAIDKNARYVYWADRNQSNIKRGIIGETDFESWEVVLNYTDMFPGIAGIDLDPGNTMIYFADAGNNKIQRADYSAAFPITGSDVELVNNPFGLDLDLINGKVYYTANDLLATNTGTLYRANLDGSGVPEVLISQPSPGPNRYMHDLKVDPIGGVVYWAFTEADGPATIYKADIANVGGTVMQLIATTSGEVRGIEIDPSTNKLWWVCRGKSAPFTPPAIMQANLSDGSNIMPLHQINVLPPNGNFIALDGGPASPLLLTSTTPTKNQINVAANSDLTLTFDQAVNSSSANNNNIVITGKQTGLLNGTFSGGGTPTITFNPTSDFKPGEQITVTVTNGVTGVSGGIANPSVFQFTVASGVGPGTFSAEKIITTNADGAISIFAVDIDGDNDMDIVSASTVDDKIAWHENDGSQNFTERIISVLADDPRSVYAADVDGDGDMDVLSASIGDQKIAWYENDGSQNFTERIIDINPAVFPVYIAAIDLDSDGDLDVVGSSTSNGVGWYENNGAQVFTYQVIDNSIDLRGPLYPADIDKDGDMDLATSSSLNHVIAWHENDGAQTFSQRIISSSAQQPNAIFVIDIDEDGDSDILSPAFDFSRIYLWANDGTQTFGQNTVTTTLLNARDVYAADMDGDGDIDVLGASQTDNEVAFYDNDGSEVFTENIVSALALAVQAVIAADMDGDGDLDIISASAADDKIAWYENSSPATSLNLLNTNPVQSTNGVSVNAVINLNFDQNVNTTTVNNTNIIVTGEQTGIIAGTFSGGGTPAIQFDPTTDFKSGEVIRVTLTTGLQSTLGGSLGASFSFQFTTGTAVSPETPPFFEERVLSNTASGTFAIFPADVDGDGDMDALGTASGSNGISWFENDGSQNFTERVVTNTSIGPTGIYAADLDSDGDMDILVAAQSSGSVFWYENDGSQTFTERTVSIAAGTPSKVYAMDMDGDGDQDVVSTSFEPVGTTNARLMWHENDGSENFTDRVIPGINGTSAYPIDVDNDGDVDLVATSEAAFGTTAFNNELLWFENDGSQNFTERIIDNTSRIQVDSYATDMDGDGDVDILMVGSLNFVGWFENDGSQNFIEHEIGSSESQPRSVFASDIDGDNDIDVMVAHELLDEISLWINDGSQNFIKQIVTTSADLAWDVYAADMDSDGDMDILSASRFGNELSWYENKVSLCPTPVTSNAGINQTVCSGSSISISGVVTNTTSSLWSTSGDGTFANAAMPVTSYTPGTSDISSGIVLLTLTANDPDGAGPCVAAASTISNTIDQSATVAVGNDISICPTDVVSLAGIIGGSASNQLWTSSGTGSFDDDTSLSATYTPSPADVTTGSIDLTLTVDAAGVCPQISDQLNVDISFCEIVAHNGISPNGDGLNDYFKIDNIELISPQNKVSIFTRWGDKVFEIENYDNQIRRFEGKSDSGKELASGVYFYKIMLNNGSSEQTGYLTLKR